MEKILILLIPVLIGIGLLRLLLIPMKAVFKLVAYSGCGFSCLWLLNCVSGFTGIFCAGAAGRYGTIKPRGKGPRGLKHYRI